MQAARLTSLFLLVVLVSINTTALADFTKISVQEAYQLASQGKVMLIDIRAETEWQDSGVAPLAKTVSMHQEGGIAAFEKELTELLDGDKSKPIALICAGGVRSDRMQHYLKQKGFSSVADVKEGMLGGWVTKGWIDQGLPVVTYSNYKNK